MKKINAGIIRSRARFGGDVDCFIYQEFDFEEKRFMQMLMIQLFGSAGNSNFAFFQNLADVPAILGYGINGLGFLLAFLGYLLIRRKQNRERPNKSILNSLYIFMGFSILLSVIGLTSQAMKDNSDAKFHKAQKEIEALRKDNHKLLEKVGGLENDKFAMRNECDAKLSELNERIAGFNETTNQDDNEMKKNLLAKDNVIAQKNEEIRNLNKDLIQKNQRLSTITSGIRSQLEVKGGVIDQLEASQCTQGIEPVKRVLQKIDEQIRNVLAQ